MHARTCKRFAISRAQNTRWVVPGAKIFEDVKGIQPMKIFANRVKEHKLYPTRNGKPQTGQIFRKTTLGQK